MKETSKRLIRGILLTLAVLLLAVLCAVSCHTNGGNEETTLPDTIPVVPDDSGSATSDTEAVTDPATETDTEQDTTPRPSAVVFPGTGTPDYTRYITATRIHDVLAGNDALVIGLKAAKGYRCAELEEYSADLVEVTDGDVLVHADFVCDVYGVTGSSVTGMATPQAVAGAIGKKVLVYDHKLVMFFDGGETLDTYHDLYTLEAMYLYMTDASEEDIVNAFIDLPDRISNGKNNAVYYTAPDLNLGVQSSVYFAQMGAVTGVAAGPRIVAGEGYFMGDETNEANHTVVRVLNQQQTVTAQFLAFDPSVRGGVQVAAAQVGNETLIATAPFVRHDGKNGDIRVFDTFGTLRMEITLNPILEGPYTILTGHFVAGRADETLLVLSRTMTAEGELPMLLVDLADGSVISRNTLNCAFALPTAEGLTREVAATVRTVTDGTEDSVILHFKARQAVYEGNARTGEFKNSGISLPDIATGVYASANPGERYIVTLPEIEGEENRSFVVAYDNEGSNNGLLDVAFRENVFYTARFWKDNDDTYVSAGSFNHIRCDLGNGVMGALNGASSSAKVEQVFDSATYASYGFGVSNDFIQAFRTSHMFLEPCFTHRWNKIPGTRNLQNYVNSYTGAHDYISIGKNGEASEYLELDSSFYIGTYADGILDLAKLRLYPLRSFLRTMAVEFRGENGNPEHLVGVSPVHEHEINVPGSVGDYNQHMIQGFRLYLLQQFGSLEQINQKLGTTFASVDEIDPPRDSGRGEWDLYQGDYFTQWALYNRYIVSKRIIEAYREALIAGYPPESISAHQIPEGDAVSGFLGQADTRLSPIDVVLTCGTAYGGTRYGYIVNSGDNWINVANRAGQWNISIGEYCALQGNVSGAYTQLEYMWKRGVRMLHHITFSDEQSLAEKGAIEQLAEKNMPRPGYTGGTTSSMGVSRDGVTYNIIQIGDGVGTNGQGLLKSVTAAGKWEGTVYVVPFHSYVNITTLEALNQPMEGCTNIYSTGILSPFIKNSDMVELTLRASYSGAGKAFVRFSVYNSGCEMPASVVEFELTDTLSPYRYVLSNQLSLTNAEVRVEFRTADGGDETGLRIENMLGTLQQDSVGIKFLEKRRVQNKSKPHIGGVTFDLLDREVKR